MNQSMIPGATFSGPFGVGAGVSSFNGTFLSGQTSSFYNVGDDTAANFERLNISWSANLAQIQTQAGGTGTVRNISINGGTFSATGAFRAGAGGAAPNSTLESSSSFGAQISNIAIDATLTNAHFAVFVDATAANRTITLPTAASAVRRIYVVKKVDASVNTVTIDPAGAELIDGTATRVLSTQYSSIMFQSDGTQWWILADR